MRESLWREIHKLNSEKLSRRAIARRLGIHRRTVRKALAYTDRPPKRSSRNRGSIIDPFRGWTLAKLQQYPELKSPRIFEMLKERGYEGGLSLVRQTVAQLRPSTKRAYQTQHFEPGESAQVDWGTWEYLDVTGGRRRISFFSMVLCHSRLLYVEFFLGTAMEFWLQAHRHAMEYFGGVPGKVVVDNCKTAVLKARTATESPVLNPYYQSFADHYGFDIIACDPYQPNQKGGVENTIGYIRTSFLGGREPTSVEAMNASAQNWLVKTANCRVHGTTNRKPREHFEAAEKDILIPLPRSPHACSAVTTVTSKCTCRIHFDSNIYSVGSDYASTRLILHADIDRIRLFTPDGTFVCEHLRSYEYKQEVIDPEHIRQLIATNRHSRNEVQIKAFLTLGSAAATYLQGLKDKRPNYKKHIRAINGLIDIYGADHVSRALMDANDHQAYSADQIENLLAAWSRPDAQPGPLHISRQSDLLDISIPQPDLDIYTPTNKEQDHGKHT
ncbi:MAG: IS21 family transposase [Chloroflexi bacterium]|nr:MAG: IS21 family transposase [Chloroflexota bacterium]